MEVKNFYDFITRNKLCSNLQKQIKTYDGNQTQNAQTKHISLGFIHKGIPESECEILRLGLAQFTDLTHLDIRIRVNNFFDFEQVITNISQALRYLKFLTNFKFGCSGQVNIGGASELGKGISSLNNLINLDLIFEQHVNIFEQGCVELAKGIRCLKNLQFLTLIINSENKIGEIGFNSLGLAITELKQLTHLVFRVYSNNHLEATHQNKIDFSLELLSQLKQFSFYIYCNPVQIQDQHFISKAKTLSHLTQLTNLNLNIFDNLSEQYFIYLGESLAMLQNANDISIVFKTLKSSDNKSAKSLGKGLSKLQQLRKLSIYIEQINNDDILALVQGLKQIYSLTDLALQFSKINETQELQTHLWQGMSNLKSLQNIIFQSNLKASTMLAQELSSLNIKKADFSIFRGYGIKDKYHNKQKYLDLVIEFAKFKNLNYFILYVDENINLKSFVRRKFKKLVRFIFNF